MHAWRPTLTLALGLALGACSDDDKPVSDSGTPDGPVVEADAGVDRGGDVAAPDAAPGKSGKLVILHTNDLHAAVQGGLPVADYTPLSRGDDETKGGFARLGAAIAKARETAGERPVLVLDAGDFTMGSPFDMLATTKYPVLALMEQMGYDAIVIGNHELEGSPAITAAMLDAAKQGGFKVPLLLSNIEFDAQDPGDDALEALQTEGFIKRKVVKELSNGLKVGIFGLLGEKAWGVAYGLGSLTFAENKTVAAALVKELREQDGVDLVICVSHSGLDEQGKGADADLASEVPGIDVIVGGHSHTELTQPVVVGETIIVQAGAQAEVLGQLELDIVNGKANVEKFELVPIDDTIQGEAAIQTAIEGFVAEVDALLAADGLSYSKVIAETSFDMTFPEFQEAPMGNLITDAYRHAVAAVETDGPVDVAFDSRGVIGDPILKGKTGQIWYADVHHAVKAGYGPDGRVGFPLVSFYITGKELTDGMEVIAVAQDVLHNHDYFLLLSGAKMEFSKSAGLFHRVTSLTIGDPPVPADPDGCYKVVTNLLVGRWMGRIKDASYGVLSVEAKEKDCQTPITDLTTRLVDADPTTPGVQELKARKAVVDYMASFPDTTGNAIPDVPADLYATTQGRIVANP